MNIRYDISFTIGNTLIRPSLSVRNLGVTFHSAMTMSNHISSICKTLNIHLRNLSRVRIFMGETTCHHAIHALVLIMLTHFFRVHLVKKLAVFKDSKTELQNWYLWPKSLIMFPPLLEQLHRLPVHKCIDFKSLTIIFKCCSDCAPSYVKELITPYQPNYSGFRSSSDSRMLTKPKTNLKSFSKGFYSAAPKL